jgi:hypothetical protein
MVIWFRSPVNLLALLALLGLLSPLGERLAEGVMQEKAFG